MSGLDLCLNQTVVSPFNEYVHKIMPILRNSVETFKAGRLTEYYDAWSNLTRDKQILNTVKGLEIEFKWMPHQSFVPTEYSYTDDEIVFLQNEIQKLLKKEVISCVSSEDTKYVSNIFLREKKDGSYRMILNLKGLNKSVEYHKFKMDTLNTAISLITPGCYMASIDYKDAYYSVAVRQEDRKWLRFQFQGQLYQFNCLPNGLTSGPRLFTKLTKPLFATLREKGHINSPYIDDSLLVGETWEECVQNVMDTIDLSIELGFVVHPIKSVLDPVKCIEFLGFWLNSELMIVFLTEPKALTIKRLCEELLSYKKPTIRTVARLVGKLVASFPGVLYGKLFYRQLDNEKSLALKESAGNFEAKMKLSPLAREDLNWWISNIEGNSCPIMHEKPSTVVYSDASPQAWGGGGGSEMV